MLSDEFITETFKKIDRHQTHPTSHYQPAFSFSKQAGTAHLSVMTSDGAAVALTSSIDYKSGHFMFRTTAAVSNCCFSRFGSFLRGKRTGIIFNNAQISFAPSTDSHDHPNLMQPRKRPLSSIAPAFLLDQTGNVVTCLGASGGPEIPTAMAYVKQADF